MMPTSGFFPSSQPQKNSESPCGKDKCAKTRTRLAQYEKGWERARHASSIWQAIGWMREELDDAG